MYKTKKYDTISTFRQLKAGVICKESLMHVMTEVSGRSWWEGAPERPTCSMVQMGVFIILYKTDKIKKQEVGLKYLNFQELPSSGFISYSYTSIYI